MDIENIAAISIIVLWVYIHNRFKEKDYKELVIIYLGYCVVNFIVLIEESFIPENAVWTAYRILAPVTFIYVACWLLSKYFDVYKWVNEED